MVEIGRLMEDFEQDAEHLGVQKTNLALFQELGIKFDL